MQPRREIEVPVTRTVEEYIDDIFPERHESRYSVVEPEYPTIGDVGLVPDDGFYVSSNEIENIQKDDILTFTSLGMENGNLVVYVNVSNEHISE